jgi:hypothetical protein
MELIHRKIQNMEEPIIFPSGACSIEGLLEKNSATNGVVISHPHPLYGGNMHNNVVISITKTYQKMGYSTLRFNFRGVGNSQGSYGDGVGEQEDVRAAVSYLAGLNINQIDLIKKSYAGWNAAAQFEVMDGADHFYAGYLDKLEAILTAYLEGRK